MRILIDVANGRVKDELIETLERKGYEVERGSATSSTRRWDVVVVGSVEVAERLRSERPFDAIVVFTKIGDVEARVRALELGASDTMDGGFPISQMAARIGAAGHRAAMIPRLPERLEIDGCTIDLAASTATRNGTVVALTRRELDLVRWLSRHAGRVVTREELLQHVWHVSPNVETRAVDVAIAGLRAKLERDPKSPAIVVSVKGAGYRWG